VRVPGLEGPATVLRTTDGIATIAAVSQHDAFLLQGWVHAQDRLFQMDQLRRTASGTLAELLGPGALGSDVQLRTLGLRRAAERSWAAASPRLRAAITAYTAGVNAFLARHPVPAEYQALELTRVAPWTPVDTVVIGKLVAFQLSFDLDIDATIALQQYIAAGAASGFDGAALLLGDLVAFAPFSPAATVPDATGAPASSSTLGASAPASRAAPRAGPGGHLATASRLAQRYRAAAADVPLLRAALDRDRETGSNEWVISGRHTRNGRPILANDPHLGLSAPSIFYPIRLRAAGLRVAGEGFAGVPGVAHGQNPWIAWGSTTNPMDVTDTYLEAVRPDPTSPSGLSTLFSGQLEHVLPVPETFRANGPGNGTPDDVAVVPPGGPIPPATLIVPRRNNGPIVQLDVARGSALSVQYTGYSATQELESFLVWMQARDLDDFRRGVQSFDVGSQNWSYADRIGTIAYLTSAELPLREDLQAGRVTGLPPYFIRNGQGGNEWLPAGTTHPGQAVPYEILPPAEMPQLVNPPAGWFVNANNDPLGTTLDNNPLNQLRPGGGILYLSPGYDGFRGGRITEMIRSALARGHRVDETAVRRMQADTVLLDAEFFAPRIVEAWRRAGGSSVPELGALAADPRLAEAVGRLARWDFATPTGIAEGYDASDRSGRLGRPRRSEVASSVAASIYALWRSRFIASTVDATVAPFELPPPSGDQALTALKRALLGAPSLSGLDLFAAAAPGVPDPADRRDVALLAALRAALDRLASPDFAAAFGGSTDQDDYRWGKLHRLVLASPLGGPWSVPPAFGQVPAPLAGLPGLPVDGGFNVVDASSHNARADSVNGFMFGSGPARRYVGVLTRDGPEASSALPGGTSAAPSSRHYLDLLPSHLTNDYYPVRLRLADILRAIESVQVFLPDHRG
jgi:penicillin G amidase